MGQFHYLWFITPTLQSLKGELLEDFPKYGLGNRFNQWLGPGEQHESNTICYGFVHQGFLTLTLIPWVINPSLYLQDLVYL